MMGTNSRCIETFFSCLIRTCRSNNTRSCGVLVDDPEPAGVSRHNKTFLDLSGVPLFLGFAQCFRKIHVFLGHPGQDVITRAIQNGVDGFDVVSDETLPD